MIHALLDTTQVIRTLQFEGAPHEVCAEALASHDRHSNQLTVKLRAFLRAQNQDHIGEVAVPSWLPEPETVIDHVESDEAHEVANDVFGSWKQKVAGRLPG
ncbi:hypothetical protein [Prosthecobacter sp.]|uniref:hypothetical protein n=1 Tax=Prosthecobacter sp. TaxID=1965333 RepID=UPI001D3D5586|nr:hypothetical protein [Prosthecobacter sp.]MCB1276387.1 hypothetical protein [Prosthecobacter sp.]